MSALLATRNFMERRTGALFHFLHIDLAPAGLALLFVVAAGITANFNWFGAKEIVRPHFGERVEIRAVVPESVRAPRLQPVMAAALDQVAQRYRVSAEALLPVFEAVQAAGRELRIDPLLIIAVISVESRFNPYSQSPMGAVGLMQIIPRFHMDKLSGEAESRAFLDPAINVRIGARILQESIQRQGGLMEGLQYYAGAIDDGDQIYANKVLAEKARLEQASRRREGAAG